ncbi:Hypp4123 [Branchiostoma lanceolatum]|uniref:Hypp4123 protein n=1 Tax=Branchiostoma lanceolatum TaxID=7740 RepID=A0A8K0EUF3_BRALA|nr:Hypp4123 [Branchiostoma lanceolatum]
MAGKVSTKYRMLASLRKETGIGRRVLRGAKTKSMKEKRRKLSKRREKLKDSIIAFLGREDNARMMPGKRDTAKKGKETVQRRILTDYMKNLHKKYWSENPGVKVSLASFCRYRPLEFQLPSFLTRDTCYANDTRI